MSSSTAAIGSGALRRRTMPANAQLALLGDVAAKASAFAVTVIAARELRTSEFALLGVCLALVTVLTTGLDAGVSVLLVREGARSPALRTSLLHASARGRIPLVAAAALVAVVYGSSVGHLPDALAVVGASVVGACSLSLLGVLRAAQNLAFEALQKLLSGALALGLTIVCLTQEHSATAVLVAATLGPALVLPLAARRAERALQPAGAAPALATLRSAAPLGALALATLVYYRLPTLVLGHAGHAAATAQYTVAATIGFGLLAVPNAITTGLLSRLAGTEDAQERWQVCIRALKWTIAISVLLATSVAALAPWGLRVAFGTRYAETYVPLLILLVSGILIGASGVLGTWLVNERRTRAVVMQVGAALVVNAVAAVLLVPGFGAAGAAWATLVTEGVALAWLGLAVWDAAPMRGPRVAALELPGLSVRVYLLRSGVLAALGGVLALELWARRTSYGLRVISDAPSYLAIVRDMAIHPFHPISAFLRTPLVEESHATPYTQTVASLWRLLAPHDAVGRPLPDPVGLGRFLAVCGIPIAVALLVAVYYWVRRHSDERAAWLALPALLLLFGPAHVIWAGDLTFHGLLYGAYFPQTLALALLLAALLALDGPPRPRRYVLGTLAITATLLVHPFTGILLALLLAAHGSWRAYERRPGWEMGGWCLGAAFLLGEFWPSYSLESALGETGVQGRWLIGACALAPVLARGLAGRLSTRLAVLPLRALAARRLELPLALGGLALVLALGVWELWLVQHPVHDPLIHTNHLSIYWVEDRWRWPLMFAAGAVGLQGLARLALEGRPVPAFWFASCFGAGIAGVLGLPLPVWWRFLLFCQIPLALGVAVWLLESNRGWARRTVFTTFAVTAIFKVVTLTVLPTTVTYFDAALQDSYRLGPIIPAAPGLVASDPFTSYFVPGTTGHRVLVVTKAHVGSRAELADAEAGYRLLHRFYVGDDWWGAARSMYRAGVRYVLIQKLTSLAAPDLEAFSTGPTPLIRTRRDRAMLGTYYYRNNKVGHVIYDRKPYTLYVLDRRKLFR